MRLGDRVKLKEKYLYLTHLTCDDIGTVIRNLPQVSEAYTIDITKHLVGVEFDRPVKEGHSCDGIGKRGYCYYFRAKDLIVLNRILTAKEWIDLKLNEG